MKSIASHLRETAFWIFVTSVIEIWTIRLRWAGSEKTLFGCSDFSTSTTKFVVDISSIFEKVLSEIVESGLRHRVPNSKGGVPVRLGAEMLSSSDWRDLEIFDFIDSKT